MILTVLHAYGVQVDIEKVADKHVPHDKVYLMDANWKDRQVFLRTLRGTEIERDRAIARYDNVLKGLKYWQKRALTEQKTK